jgi:hypothetical protein
LRFDSSSHHVAVTICRMSRRWTGKTKTNDFHGNHIEFITVGGRTTAYAPALQLKPKGAGQGAAAKKKQAGKAKQSPAPAAPVDAVVGVGESFQAQQNGDDNAAPAQKPLAQKLTAAQANKQTRAVGASAASKKSAQLSGMDGTMGNGTGAATDPTRSRTVRATRGSSSRPGSSGPVVQETSQMLMPDSADPEKHLEVSAVKVAEVKVTGGDGAVVAEAVDAQLVEDGADEDASAVPRRVRGKRASTATDRPGKKPQQRESSDSKRSKRK